LPNWWKIN